MQNVSICGPASQKNFQCNIAGLLVESLSDPEFDGLDCKLADSKVEGVRIIEVVRSKSPFAFPGLMAHLGDVLVPFRTGKLVNQSWRSRF